MQTLSIGFGYHQIFYSEGLMFDPSSTLLGKDIQVEAWADNGEKIKVLKVILEMPKTFIGIE